jgi:hypothetical protein
MDFDEPPEFVHAGGDVDHVKVTLSVSGDDLDPAEVSRTLGQSPTFAARRGDVRKSRDATVTQPTGVWLLEVGDSREWVLADAIRALLNKLPPPSDSWARLAGRFTLRISVGLFLEQWNRGCALPPDLIAELAARHLGLDFDIYGNTDGDA